MAGELIAFVSQQCEVQRDGARLPGVTEPLECAFGKQKSLERSPTKNGFTSLLLGLGAIVGQTTAQLVHEAHETCSIKHVRAWCQKHLGTTLHSQRRQAYVQAKKSDEKLAPST